MADRTSFGTLAVASDKASGKFDSACVTTQRRVLPDLIRARRHTLVCEAVRENGDQLECGSEVRAALAGLVTPAVALVAPRALAAGLAERATLWVGHHFTFGSAAEIDAMSFRMPIFIVGCDPVNGLQPVGSGCQWIETQTHPRVR